MRELSEHALDVAAWMEAQGMKEAAFAGPFGPPLPAKGDRVQIRRGALVLSTSPRAKSVSLQRALTVTVHSAHRGWVEPAARCRTGGRAASGERDVKGPEIHWAGAGGYWRWTDAANIVLAAN